MAWQTSARLIRGVNCFVAVHSEVERQQASCKRVAVRVSLRACKRRAKRLEQRMLLHSGILQPCRTAWRLASWHFFMFMVQFGNPTTRETAESRPLTF